MPMKKLLSAALAGILCSSALLGGCADAQGPAQTKTFSLPDVTAISVDYDGESVTVKQSDSNSIKIVEYMDKTKASYLASIQLSGGVLSITEGARPIGNGVHASLELYLPQAFQSSLSLHTTDGRISSALALTVSSFRADTTNGAIELSNLTAEDAYFASTGGEVLLQNLVATSCTVHTTNASTRMDAVTGAVTYEAKGGNLTATGVSGSGSFQASGDGSMALALTALSGDLSAYAKNGDISVTLPAGLNFMLSATTKDGKLETPFPDLFSPDGHSASGTIGANASVKIGLETKNGDISVTVL